MTFLLWLVVVAAVSANQDVKTESPHIVDVVNIKSIQTGIEDDIEHQTDSPQIDDVMNTKNVQILFEDDIESDTEAVTEAVTTEKADTLIVYQEIHKLDEIVRDITPIAVDEEELRLREEELELNEISSNLDDDDIVDIIHNFIADKDPMLQLFLSICFIHPACYQDTPPSSSSSIDLQSASPLAKDVAENLLDRRTERARNVIISSLIEAQEEVRLLMFKYIEIGVGARGVSVLATKKIIDSVKNIWQSVNADLEYAKSSLQELFYLLPLDTSEQVKAMMEVAEVIQTIPGKVGLLYNEATQDGYNSYISSSSWDSWKRSPKEANRK